MIRVLIVDDEPLARDLLINLIESLQAPITIVGQAGTGQEALEKIKTLKPDLVFLDIEMPGFDGLELMKRLQGYKEPIDIIVVTAFNYFEYAQKALRYGAKDILLKPVELRSLEDSISRVVGYKITDSPSLNEILKYIALNYNKKIQLNKCAKKFHISENQINRLFNKHLDTTFINYLNAYRINKALRLLDDKDKSVKEVAHEVGFNNLNYFYKTFKKFTGKTPKSY